MALILPFVLLFCILTPKFRNTNPFQQNAFTLPTTPIVNNSFISTAPEALYPADNGRPAELAAVSISLCSHVQSDCTAQGHPVSLYPNAWHLENLTWHQGNLLSC